MNRITWSHPEGGYGLVGDIHLFSIGRRSHRDGLEITLRTALPVALNADKPSVGEYATVEEAHAAAEEALERFIASVGAKFTKGTS